MVAESACRNVEHVAFLCLVLRFNSAIPFVEETRFHLNVEHLVLLAFLLASMSGQFRLTVVELKLVSHFSWQLAYDLVTAKYILAIHHQAYWLVVPVEFAVALLHSRQLLDEFVEACSLLQFESLRIEHDGVARHSDARYLCRNLHLLKH